METPGNALENFIDWQRGVARQSGEKAVMLTPSPMDGPVMAGATVFSLLYIDWNGRIVS